MIMQKERELIVDYGKKLITSGLTKGTGGNISICDRENGTMAISPSGIDYFETKPEDVVVMDLAGNVVDGNRKPSVEYSMHAIFYTDRDDVNAVVHTHSVASSTMAALHWDLPAAIYLVALGGDLKVPCAKYGRFATPDLAKVALEGMGKGYACFLANHGLLTASNNIHMAFNIAEEVEHCAEIYLKAKSAGEPVVIPDDEMMAMFEMFKSYGQKK